MLDRSLAALFKSRSGLPRVRTAHNRELIHRSAGEKLRSRSVFISGQASFVAGNSVIFQKGTQTYIRPRSLAAIKESGRGLPRVRIAFFIIGKRLTAHRSAGEEARAPFLFLLRVV